LFVATTYADTEDIILGGKVNNMTTDDVLKVINLKHAWEFILNENVIASPTNYALLSQINKLVEEGFYYNAGSLREVPVKIGGTNWQPTLPYESQVKENIDIIINNKEDSDLDKAISLLLYVTKGQLFIDGNKRTSVIFANHYLISKGLGLIVIPENKVAEYKKILIEYYEKNNNKIKDFIKKNCFLNINSEK
jgi:prophage maintenance system killer protein